MPKIDFQIRPARSKEDLQAVTRLFEAYATSLAIDLAYQDFAREVSALPGKYAPPAGELLLAQTSDGMPVGCVALRPLQKDGCCEMKRLYVASEGRGLGLGRLLVLSILQEARRLGYREMWLDTLPSMASAISLYRQAGFQPIPPYYETPVAGTLFFACQLQDVSLPTPQSTVVPGVSGTRAPVAKSS